MASAAAGRPDSATIVAFLGVALLGGLNTIAVRQTVQELAPFWGAGLRFGAAGLIFAALAIVGRRPLPRGRSLVGAAVYGLIGFAAAYGALYPALREVPAATAGVAIGLSPLVTYVLAVMQDQERLDRRALLGALVAAGGVAIVFADQLGAAVPLGGLLLVLLGTTCLAEAAVYVKTVPRSDPYATNAVAMVAASGVLLALSLLGGETQALPARSATWLAVGYITVFGSVALFGLYLFGLQRWSASGMSYSTLLLPLVSVGCATLLTGERFSASFLIGGAVMLVGVYIGAFRARRPQRSTATGMPECLPVNDCPEPVSHVGRFAAGTRS